jgi:hypothetical protein
MPLAFLLLPLVFPAPTLPVVPTDECTGFLPCLREYDHIRKVFPLRGKLEIFFFDYLHRLFVVLFRLSSISAALRVTSRLVIRA